jgi:hypothetical protein
MQEDLSSYMTSSIMCINNYIDIFLRDGFLMDRPFDFLTVVPCICVFYHYLNTLHEYTVCII